MEFPRGLGTSQPDSLNRVSHVLANVGYRCQVQHAISGIYSGNEIIDRRNLECPRIALENLADKRNAMHGRWTLSIRRLTIHRIIPHLSAGGSAENTPGVN